jgi:hypothetical protein
MPGNLGKSIPGSKILKVLEEGSSLPATYTRNLLAKTDEFHCEVATADLAQRQRVSLRTGWT